MMQGETYVLHSKNGATTQVKCMEAGDAYTAFDTISIISTSDPALEGLSKRYDTSHHCIFEPRCSGYNYDNGFIGFTNERDARWSHVGPNIDGRYDLSQSEYPNFCPYVFQNIRL